MRKTRSGVQQSIKKRAMTKGKEEDENKAKRGMSPQKTKKRPYHRTRFRRLAFQASTSWQSRWLVLMPQGAQGVAAMQAPPVLRRLCGKSLTSIGLLSGLRPEQLPRHSLTASNHLTGCLLTISPTHIYLGPWRFIYSSMIPLNSIQVNLCAGNLWFDSEYR